MTLLEAKENQNTLKIRFAEAKENQNCFKIAMVEAKEKQKFLKNNPCRGQRKLKNPQT